jgi:hypothetical protein
MAHHDDNPFDLDKLRIETDGIERAIRHRAVALGGKGGQGHENTQSSCLDSAATFGLETENADLLPTQQVARRPRCESIHQEPRA